MLRYIFPSAFMANMFAMTVLMIVLGLSGKSGLAAEVGIIQGATVALFYSFSANARSLILNQNSNFSAQSFLATRLVLLIPLAVVAYLLSVSTAGVEKSIAIVLIIRRCVEWLGDLHLSDMERLDDVKFAVNYFFLQVVLLIIILIWFFANLPFPLVGLLIWALAPLLLSYKFILRSLPSLNRVFTDFSMRLLPHIGSTSIVNISVYFFRLLILLLVGKDAAGDLFTAFAIGGLSGGVFASALGPSMVLHEQRSGNINSYSIINYGLNSSLVIGFIVYVLSYFNVCELGWTGKSNIFWAAVGISLVGGTIMVHSQKIKLIILQNNMNDHVFFQDFIINTLIIIFVPFVYFIFGTDYMIFLYFISSILSFIIYNTSTRIRKLRSA